MALEQPKKDIVSNTHGKYDATAPLRTLFEDVCDGTAKLREKCKTYLPQFPLEHKDDYAARCGSATMLNVTDKTVETMCGLVFQKDITLGDDVPPKIAALWENIDNKGNHGNVFCRDIFEESFDGWAAILVDAPTVVAGDAGQERNLGLRPYWVAYEACDVINWDYQVNPVSRKTELSLVVFRECQSVAKGRYLREDVVRYRTFFLGDNGGVYWRLDEEQKQKDAAGNATGKTVIVPVVDDTLIPKLDAIPVAFVGEPGDEPVLLDLAFTNLKHAQKLSDYEAIIHKTCVPIPFTVGVDAGEFGKITQVGATMYHLGMGSQGVTPTMAYAEVSGGSIDKARQALEDLKLDMAMLGLAMLAANRRANADVTATEKLLDTIKETSTLQVRANQLKDAIELALSFTAKYLGLEDGGSITLGATWSEMMLSAQDIQARAQLVADGSLSLESFLWTLEKADILPEDVTAVDELQRIETEMKTITPVRNAANMPNQDQRNLNNGGNQANNQTPVPPGPTGG